jgi:hypothetical protein
MQVWINCQVLPKQTRDSSAFLNVMCLFKVCTQLWTAFFIFWSGLSDIQISCSRILKGWPEQSSVCTSVILMFLCKQLKHYFQLAMTGPEDGSNKQQCFSLYYSAISQYYEVNLCQKKVSTNPSAINIMLTASDSLSRTFNIEWYHGFSVPQGL